MCICNTYIIYVTIRSARIRLPSTNQYSRHRQLSIMLIFITFAFVLLTLPSCIYFVFFRHRMPKEDDFRTYRYLVQISLGSVQFTAHAINFFLYCFSTNNFRNELRDFLREIFWYSISFKFRASSRNNSNKDKQKRKYILKRPGDDQESTLENQQTGQQFVLKDLQTALINDG